MTQSVVNSDIDLVKLAREIAMDIQPIENILKQYQITDETWSELQRNTRFLALLNTEVETWQGSPNTHERVKLKSAAMLEEWLPELNARLHDGKEPFTAVVEAGKMLAKIAGLGERTDLGGALGERFQITINMGPKVMEITKDVTPVIEGTVNESN